MSILSRDSGYLSFTIRSLGCVQSFLGRTIWLYWMGQLPFTKIGASVFWKLSRFSTISSNSLTFVHAALELESIAFHCDFGCLTLVSSLTFSLPVPSASCRSFLKDCDYSSKSNSLLAIMFSWVLVGKVVGCTVLAVPATWASVATGFIICARIEGVFGRWQL